MPAGGEQHRDRQPGRPGRLDHYLQAGPWWCGGQGGLFDLGQAREGCANAFMQRVSAGGNGGGCRVGPGRGARLPTSPFPGPCRVRKLGYDL
jgi:hypothetical protein